MMVMSVPFATTVAVVVPVILLVVGVEAREFEKRTRDERLSIYGTVIESLLQFLKEAPSYNHELPRSDNLELLKFSVVDFDRKISEPRLRLGSLWSRRAEDSDDLNILAASLEIKVLLKALAAYGTIMVGFARLGAVVSLTVVEGQCVYWLGQVGPGPESGEAQFALVTIVASIGLLFIVPVLRLAIGRQLGLSFVWISPRTLRSTFRELKRLRPYVLVRDAEPETGAASSPTTEHDESSSH
jgi:hypothetical protein